MQTNAKNFFPSKAYASPTSLNIFIETIQGLTGYKFSFPCQQQRSAEQVLFKVLECKEHLIPCNSLSWSTMLNVEQIEARTVHVVCEDSLNFFKNMPFKGCLLFCC